VAIVGGCEGGIKASGKKGLKEASGISWLDDRSGSFHHLPGPG